VENKTKLIEIGRVEIRDYILDYNHIREWLSAMEQSGAKIFIALKEGKK